MSMSPWRPSALTGGTPGTGSGIEMAVADDPKPAGRFRHEHASVRQECDRPRLLKFLCDDDDAQIPFLCRLEGKRTVTERWRRPHNRRRHAWTVALTIRCTIGFELSARRRRGRHGQDTCERKGYGFEPVARREWLKHCAFPDRTSSAPNGLEQKPFKPHARCGAG